MARLYGRVVDWPCPSDDDFFLLGMPCFSTHALPAVLFITFFVSFCVFFVSKLFKVGTYLRMEMV